MTPFLIENTRDSLVFPSVSKPHNERFVTDTGR